MAKTSIANAINILTDLLKALEDAYWETSTMENKDRFFDVIMSVYEEQTELAKLSIQDHHFDYEPISAPFRRCQAHLNDLKKNIDSSVGRTTTATRLEGLISDCVGLFDN